MSQCTVERFLRDVTEHKMEIQREDGINRHVRFKKPGSSAYYFDLITWPGALCITGDMGTYVFRRLNDMFEFFRTDRKFARPDRPLPINEGYWSEKLISVACNGHGQGSATEFDPNKFKQVINDYRMRWMREMKEQGHDREARQFLWKAVDDDVLACLDDGIDRAMNAAYDFVHRADGKVWHFEDLFEHRFERYKFHFTWICYALTWGIQQYDLAKENKGETA